MPRLEHMLHCLLGERRRQLFFERGDPGVSLGELGILLDEQDCKRVCASRHIKL